MIKDIDTLGRIQLPVKMRKECGMIGENNKVEIEVQNGSIVISNPKKKEEREVILKIIDELKENANEHDNSLLDYLKELV